MNLKDRPQKYKPSTPAEGKIWNKYNDTKIIKPGQIDDRWDWIPIWKWPMDLAKGVMKRELGYTQRFRLFLYFVGNGMSPEAARDLLMEMVDKNHDHIESLYQNLERNKRHWSYYDDQTKRITTLAETEVWSMEHRPSRPVAAARPVPRRFTSRRVDLLNRPGRRGWLRKQDRVFDSDYESDEYELEYSTDDSDIEQELPFF